MIDVQVFTVNMIRENCYIISDDTKEAVIVDCGALYGEEKAKIKEYVSDKGLKLNSLICTHAHFDHVVGDEFIFETYGLKPRLHVADMWLFDHVEEQAKEFIGEKITVKMPQAGEYLGYGDVIRFGNHAFSVLATPGHTPGGISFYCSQEHLLLSGDSIFRHSIGRTDFPYGDENVLIKSLKENVMTLPDDTMILPGHGPSTTIKKEKEENPFFLE